MRFLATTLMLTLSFSAFAQDLNSQIQTKVSSLKTMTDSGQTRILDNVDKQTMISHLDAALEIVENNRNRRDDRMDRRADRRGNRGNRGRGEWSRRSSYDRNTVTAYTDNSCNSYYKIVELQPRDNCSRLTLFSTQTLGSVKINGTCVNTPNTTFGRACNGLVALTAAQKPRAEDLIVYSDNSCNSYYKVATIDPGVDCSALGSVLSGITTGSVKLHNQCVNITNTTFNANKCVDFQDAVYASYENDGTRRQRGSIELFSDNSCNSYYKVLDVGRNTDCSVLNKLFNGHTIGSAKFRGQCVNIPNTTFLNACTDYSRQ